VRLTVDPVLCDGRGLCAELLPWLVTLDDWGFPIVRDDTIDEGSLGEVSEAVRVCPRLALRLEGPDA
jgi:ferredoxin